MSCMSVCATAGLTLSPASSNTRTTVRTYHEVEGANLSAHWRQPSKVKESEVEWVGLDWVTLYRWWMEGGEIAHDVEETPTHPTHYIHYTRSTNHIHTTIQSKRREGGRVRGREAGGKKGRDAHTCVICATRSDRKWSSEDPSLR